MSAPPRAPNTELGRHKSPCRMDASWGWVTGHAPIQLSKQKASPPPPHDGSVGGGGDT